MVAQQAIERSSEHDSTRTLVLALWGGAYCGMAQHWNYNVLYGALFGHGTSLRNAMPKIAFDSLLMCPLVAHSSLYSTKGLLEGEGVWAGLHQYQREFTEVNAQFVKIWVPVGFFTFTVVPAPFRVGFCACVSMFWLTLLSLMSHRGDTELHDER